MLKTFFFSYMLLKTNHSVLLEASPEVEKGGEKEGEGEGEGGCRTHVSETCRGSGEGFQSAHLKQVCLFSLL